MKVQPSPTSPKQRASHQAEALARLYRDDAYPALERPAAPPRSAAAWFAVTVVFGALAGAVGALAFIVFLWNPQNGFGEKNTNAAPNANTVRREKGEEKSLAGVPSSLLALYARGAATKEGTLPTYATVDQIGSAVLLTDDGWAVTTKSVLEEESSLVAVTADRKMLAVHSAVRDPATNLAFFRIDGTAYTPAALDEGTPGGDAASYAVAGNQQEGTVVAVPAPVADRRFPIQDGALSSDRVSATYALDRQLPERFRGGALVADGRVLGILDGDAEAGLVRIWPVRVFQRMLDGLFRSGTLQRARLGVTYVDRATVAGLPEPSAEDRRTGAYIVANGVAASSPASESGLKAGDVITAVNETQLSEQTSVHDFVATSVPDEEIAVTYVRKGVEYKVTVTLGLLASQEE